MTPNKTFVKQIALSEFNVIMQQYYKKVQVEIQKRLKKSNDSESIFLSVTYYTEKNI